jgi:hypothetical protein
LKKFVIHNKVISLVNKMSFNKNNRTSSFASKFSSIFKKKESEVSWPTDFRLTSHVDFDVESGLTGVPK